MEVPLILEQHYVNFIFGNSAVTQDPPRVIARLSCRTERLNLKLKGPGLSAMISTRRSQLSHLETLLQCQDQGGLS